MYKRFFKSYDYTSAYNSFQLTGVWGLNFADQTFFVNPTVAMKWNF